MVIIGQKRRAGSDEDDGERWLNHYCSNHEILLVGEGDFSFSLSLAESFGSAPYLLATSLDSYQNVVAKYKKARYNLNRLKFLGASVFHGVDATEMNSHIVLKMRKFDRIIFNFPHAGFHGREDNVLIIQMHQRLVSDFFKNAGQMLQVNGEIHVNHKTTPPFCNWDIIQLALQNSLELVGCAAFKKQDYPGYSNKRGQGQKCDSSFPLGECCTFKFSFMTQVMQMNAISRQITHPFQEIPTSSHYHPISFQQSHPHTSKQHRRTRFKPDRSQLTYSINEHGYQTQKTTLFTNQNLAPYHTTSLNTAEVYASRNPTFEEPLGNAIVEFLRRSSSLRLDGISERIMNDRLYRLNLLRLMLQRRHFVVMGERIDAYTTPEIFCHW